MSNNMKIRLTVDYYEDSRPKLELHFVASV
jgi:hypothetical protein